MPCIGFHTREFTEVIVYSTFQTIKWSFFNHCINYVHNHVFQLSEVPLVRSWQCYKRRWLNISVWIFESMTAKNIFSVQHWSMSKLELCCNPVRSISELIGYQPFNWNLGTLQLGCLCVKMSFLVSTTNPHLRCHRSVHCPLAHFHKCHYLFRDYSSTESLKNLESPRSMACYYTDWSCHVYNKRLENAI